MPSSALDLCTLAWGAQTGYVSISLRDPTVDKQSPGYWKDLSFKWPTEQPRIAQVLNKAKTSSKDVYWAPAVFKRPGRDQSQVNDLTTLWADLDEVNPRDLPRHLKPTAAWQSSPGRWQALWVMEHSLKPKYQSELNQRLTYAVGADKGGWGLTKVLRTPDTHNHKYTEQPIVSMEWLNGVRVNPTRLVDDLPELLGPRLLDEKLQNPSLLLKRYKGKLKARANELIKARHASVGTRSDRLWELECLLAEVGMTAPEIASVVQSTVWNKFEGRKDEINRLLTEAHKVIEHVGITTTPELESDFEEVDDDEETGPQTWSEFDRSHKAISWMVADIWGESEVGFISGAPKSYKSWLALDLAVSVATGTRFLGTFQAKKHAVLLVQEEDPKPVLQDRLVKVAATKGLIEVEKLNATEFEMKYELPDNLHIISNQGFTLDEVWLESLEQWIREKDIKLVILDPLMMIAGGSFDEFKAFEFMEKVLKPLKRVRARTQAAIVLVHHHTKGDQQGGAKGMYGSVALWAWEEAALHLQISGVGKVTAERFSKHSLLSPILVEVGDVAEQWSPEVNTSGAISSLLDLLASMDAGATVAELELASGLGRDAVTRQLKALEGQGRVSKAGTSIVGSGRPKIVWKTV